MFDRIKEALIDFVVYAATVIIFFATTAWFVMLVGKPLVDLTYAQSVSAVVLVFLFFAIGKIDFSIEDEDY